MRISRQRGTPHRPSWWASMLGAVALTASLGACSSGPQGIVINLYGGAIALGEGSFAGDKSSRGGGALGVLHVDGEAVFLEEAFVAGDPHGGG